MKFSRTKVVQAIEVNVTSIESVNNLGKNRQLFTGSNATSDKFSAVVLTEEMPGFPRKWFDSF